MTTVDKPEKELDERSPKEKSKYQDAAGYYPFLMPKVSKENHHICGLSR